MCGCTCSLDLCYASVSMYEFLYYYSCSISPRATPTKRQWLHDGRNTHIPQRMRHPPVTGMGLRRFRSRLPETNTTNVIPAPLDSRCSDPAISVPAVRCVNSRLQGLVLCGSYGASFSPGAEGQSATRQALLFLAPIKVGNKTAGDEVRTILLSLLGRVVIVGVEFLRSVGHGWIR